MRLNEDYFDDLKLTDDDIESSDGIANDNYHSPEEWYIDMKSKYSHCLVISVCELTEPDTLSVKVPNVFKKLKYMFDMYGIEHSEPVFQDEDDYYHYAVDNILGKYRKSYFLDYHGFKMITQEDLKNYEYMFIFIYFNLPNAHSYTTACNFIRNITKCIWSNNGYNNYFIQFYIRNISKKSIQPDVRINRLTIHEATSDRRTIKMKIIDTLHMFFPEKDEEILKYEVDNDRKLYQKLSKRILLF